MSKTIYVLSGLGVDERVFKNLDFSTFRVVYIDWIIPLRNESIAHYAKRLTEQIESKNPILIGLSFGGMMAIEISKQIATQKVILISSAKTKNEIPIYYRFFGFIGLHKILPARLLKSSNFVTNWFFGVSSSSDKQLLKQILDETDSYYLKWAIDKIVRWKNVQIIPNTFHIHGTKDRILPSFFIKCDVLIQQGGHFMVLNRSKELNAILHEQLLKI